MISDTPLANTRVNTESDNPDVVCRLEISSQGVETEPERQFQNLR